MGFTSTTEEIVTYVVSGVALFAAALLLGVLIGRAARRTKDR